jgi:hypothetical protein
MFLNPRYHMMQQILQPHSIIVVHAQYQFYGGKVCGQIMQAGQTAHEHV